jgi:hypothetical protein
MTRPSQKREERIALDRFLEVYGPPHGAPQDGREGTEPDCLVRFGGDPVGIEITDDIWQHRRNVEAARAEVVRRAQDLYRSRNKPPLQVTVHWADETIPGNRARMATTLESAIERMVPPGAGEAEENDFRLYRLGLPELFRVAVLRHPAITRDVWSSADAGGVREIDDARISELIRKKEAKHKAFLDSAEAWLLIANFDDTISGSYDIGQAARDRHYETRFAKVFALNVPAGKLIEFQVGRPASSAVADTNGVPQGAE